MPTVRKFLEKINIEGDVAFEEPMALHTSFRVGGPAEALVAPRGRSELLRLAVAAREEGIPLFMLGGGANILVGDRGLRGLVVESRGLSGLELAPQGARAAGGGLSGGGTLLVAEAGLPMDRLGEEAAARGLAGLASFYGMPGSVGGSVFMNARCYEVEMADRLAWVEWLDPARGAADGVSQRAIDPAEWSYKRSPFQPGGACAGGLVLAAAFRVEPGEPAAIRALMAEKRADREAKGHYRLPSAGSVFKNDRRLGKPTGRILDELGLRGRRIGGAMVSEWHANIFVNSGGAKASDILALIDLAREEARKRLGVELEPEVLAIGDF